MASFLASFPPALSLLFLPFLLPLASSTPLLNSSAHDQLSLYGFPIGLLPDTVLSYDLAPSGFFKIFLDGDCHFLIPDENYPVTYASVVAGSVSYGHIKDLQGVSVKAFFKRWTITGIRVRGDDLVFEVGLLHVNYPAANFDESPFCEVGTGESGAGSKLGRHSL